MKRRKGEKIADEGGHLGVGERTKPPGIGLYQNAPLNRFELVEAKENQGNLETLIFDYVFNVYQDRSMRQ